MSEEPAPAALSIIVPALNERDRLPPTLEKIAAFAVGDPRWLPTQIVVVDDGSRDGTGQAAASVELPPSVTLRLETHAENRGKGAAVRTGFAVSTGALVLLSDADLSSPIEELGTLAGEADSGAVAIGSRAVDRRLITTRQPLYRDAMGRIFNLAVRTLALGDLKDTQCGFKLYPGDLARALAGVQRLDGFAFDVEHLVVARHWGFAIREIGVRWGHVEASRVLAIRHSAQMFRDVLRVSWWRVSGNLPDRPGAL